MIADQFARLLQIAAQAQAGCTVAIAWLTLVALPDEAVRLIWDEWDGISEIGEAAHCELNRRGLGEYCAV